MHDINRVYLGVAHEYTIEDSVSVLNSIEDSDEKIPFNVITESNYYIEEELPKMAARHVFKENKVTETNTEESLLLMMKSSLN